MKFNERLKQLRIKSPKMQKEITKELEINLRTWQNYEHGDAEPDIETLIKIADYFEVSIDYLTGRTHNPEINHEQLDHGKNVG